MLPSVWNFTIIFHNFISFWKSVQILQLIICFILKLWLTYTSYTSLIKLLQKNITKILYSWQFVTVFLICLYDADLLYRNNSQYNHAQVNESFSWENVYYLKVLHHKIVSKWWKHAFSFFVSFLVCAMYFLTVLHVILLTFL